MEPSDLQEMCFLSGIDKNTETLIKDLCETYLESEALNIETVKLLKACDDDYNQIPLYWRRYSKFLIEKIDCWISGSSYSQILQSLEYIKPFSTSYQTWIKDASGKAKAVKKTYSETLKQRVQHYYSHLEAINRSLKPLYD